MLSELSEDEKLKNKFALLIRELCEAKFHFMLYGRLREASGGTVFHNAWEFWNYTITAHAVSALIHICRVYDDCRWVENDPKRNAFHLLRLVTEIEKFHKDKLENVESNQLKIDMEFLQKQNPNQSVGKLRAWRNNVICHRNLDLVLGGRDDFFKKNGFDDKEIQGLVENGFSILGRWANYYKSDYSCWIRVIDDSITKEEVGAMPAFETFLKKLHVMAKQ